MDEQVKRAAIYARSATVQELVPDYALDAQMNECKRYLLNKGYQMISELVYSEVTNGTNGDRPGLAALREAANRGEFDVLVVYDHDRLARSPLQVAVLLAELEQDGVQVESIREPHREAVKPERRTRWTKKKPNG
jgi:DNA invertase Pin-like site-specific DNA recombinase